MAKLECVRFVLRQGLGACAALALAASAESTLLNGGLADGSGNDPDHWAENSLAKAGREGWGSHDGDGYLMALYGWNESAGTYGAIWQDVGGVVPAQVYTLVFWQDGDGSWNGSNVTARLIWLDSGSNVLGSVTKNLDDYTQVSWSFHTLSGTAPKRAAILRVQFDAETLASGGGGAAKFDELSLTVYPPGLANPGFRFGVEFDAFDWSEVASTENARRESWGSHDGDGYLMALPGYTSGSFGAFSQEVPGIRAGYRCSLSFWQEGDGGWNGSNVTARLIWLDGEAAALGSVTTNLDAYTGGAVAWTEVTLQGVAPQGAAAVRVQFDAESPSGGGGAAKFDDLLLTLTAPRGTGIFLR
ncbi:MAG: hypothetical protein RBT78_03685 [Kiritimatiellia bacterium]|jgi:hypothetical protein|nr:hypothetical protein [Kiritimatiellia bacterium]